MLQYLVIIIMAKSDAMHSYENYQSKRNCSLPHVSFAPPSTGIRSVAYIHPPVVIPTISCSSDLLCSDISSSNIIASCEPSVVLSSLAPAASYVFHIDDVLKSKHLFLLFSYCCGFSEAFRPKITAKNESSDIPSFKGWHKESGKGSELNKKRAGKYVDSLLDVSCKLFQCYEDNIFVENETGYTKGIISEEMKGENIQREGYSKRTKTDGKVCETDSQDHNWSETISVSTEIKGFGWTFATLDSIVFREKGKHSFIPHKGLTMLDDALAVIEFELDLTKSNMNHIYRRLYTKTVLIHLIREKAINVYLTDLINVTIKASIIKGPRGVPIVYYEQINMNDFAKALRTCYRVKGGMAARQISAAIVKFKYYWSCASMGKRRIPDECNADDENEVYGSTTTKHSRKHGARIKLENSETNSMRQSRKKKDKFTENEFVDNKIDGNHLSNHESYNDYNTNIYNNDENIDELSNITSQIEKDVPKTKGSRKKKRIDTEGINKSIVGIPNGYDGILTDIRSSSTSQLTNNELNQTKTKKMRTENNKDYEHLNINDSKQHSYPYNKKNKIKEDYKGDQTVERINSNKKTKVNILSQVDTHSLSSETISSSSDDSDEEIEVAEMATNLTKKVPETQQINEGSGISSSCSSSDTSDNRNNDESREAGNFSFSQFSTKGMDIKVQNPLQHANKKKVDSPNDVIISSQLQEHLKGQKVKDTKTKDKNKKR